MPTDTKLNNLVINYLTQEQYNAIATKNEDELYLTPDNSTGGGGVSPTLNLLTEDLSAVRTSITEEEKVNLEKGLYNSVLFIDFSLGDGATTGMLFPQRLVGLGGDFMFSSYKAIPGRSEADDWTFLGASTYGLSIGEKTSDGNYPITINKLNDVKGIQTIGATESLDETDGSIKLTMDSAPSGEMFILSLGEDSSFVNALMVRDVDGNYYGCSNDGDTTGYFCIFINADGTGSAFSYYSGFLYSQKEQTDGKVLTIQNKRAEWTTTPRYEHTITIKNSAGKILWTQTMRNSSNTVVNSYANLKTLFGEATYAGFGEYCQLNLEGGTEATDKLIKADGTEVTLASLGAIVYTDKCFLPK